MRAWGREKKIRIASGEDSIYFIFLLRTPTPLPSRHQHVRTCTLTYFMYYLRAPARLAHPHHARYYCHRSVVVCFFFFLSPSVRHFSRAPPTRLRPNNNTMRADSSSASERGAPSRLAAVRLNATRVIRARRKMIRTRGVRDEHSDLTANLCRPSTRTVTRRSIQS